MKAARTTSRPWIAFVAAWLMLVQSVAGSIAAPGQTVDAFGNALCITSEDHTQPAQQHHELPGCCILGCSALGSGVAPPSDVAWLDVSLQGWLVRYESGAASIEVAAEDHNPGSPRAPPA